jgi:hypothetical protein
MPFLLLTTWASSFVGDERHRAKVRPVSAYITSVTGRKCKQKTLQLVDRGVKSHLHLLFQNEHSPN